MKKFLSNRFSPNIIGIILMVGMVVCVLIVGSLVKYFGNNIDFRIVIAARFLFSLPILYFVGWKIRGKNLFYVNAKHTLIARIVIGSVAICLWFLAIRNAEFGQVTALNQSATLFVALLAPLLLNEMLGTWRISAIIFGLLGIFLITNPFSGDLSIGLVYALLGAIASALLSITLRNLGMSDEPITVTIWHNSFGFIFFSVLLLFNTPIFNIINIKTISLLVLLGIFGSLLQLFLTYSFKYGEAIILTPIRYLSVPGAMMVGYIFWGEYPKYVEFIGAVITISSCLIIAWREIVRNKKIS